MLIFAASVFFLIITPGPGVLSTAGVGASFGTRAGVSYLIGLFLGTNLVAIAVVTGLAAILLAEPRIRTVLLVLSTLYLLYLALRIAFAGARVAFIEQSRPPGWMSGVALQIVNPKAYAVNTTLFSGFNFMASSFVAETALKFLIINLIWIPLHLLWLWAGIKLNSLDLSPPAQRRINYAMSAAMLLVVFLAGSGLTR